RAEEGGLLRVQRLVGAGAARGGEHAEAQRLAVQLVSPAEAVAPGVAARPLLRAVEAQVGRVGAGGARGPAAELHHAPRRSLQWTRSAWGCLARGGAVP